MCGRLITYWRLPTPGTHEHTHQLRPFLYGDTPWHRDGTTCGISSAQVAHADATACPEFNPTPTTRLNGRHTRYHSTNVLNGDEACAGCVFQTHTPSSMTILLNSLTHGWSTGLVHTPSYWHTDFRACVHTMWSGPLLDPSQRHPSDFVCNANRCIHSKNCTAVIAGGSLQAVPIAASLQSPQSPPIGHQPLES